MNRALTSRFNFPINRIFLNCRQNRFIGDDRVIKSPCIDVSLPETNLYSHIFQHFPKYGKKTAHDLSGGTFFALFKTLAKQLWYRGFCSFNGTTKGYYLRRSIFSYFWVVLLQKWR